MKLSDSVTTIKGVGAKKQTVLEEMGITTIYDLLEHSPFRYQNRLNRTHFMDVPEDKDVLIGGVLINKRLRSIGRGRTMLECALRDESGIFHAIFFNMPFLEKNLRLGNDYTLFGKMKWRNGAKTIVNPEMYPANSPRDIRGIIPVYRRSAGISSNELSKLILSILDEMDESCEWLGDELLEKNNLAPEYYAYRNIHFPESVDAYNRAKFRLIYDKLLAFQYCILYNRRFLDEECGNSMIAPVDISKFLDSLPFRLTEGQQTAVDDIEHDLMSTKTMNRLVQGDAGCGKTVVAETAIFHVVSAGWQAAFMAPTEILARQHFAKLTADFGEFGMRTALLVSGIKSTDRREILEGISSGDIDIVIGTHALIQSDVEFAKLGLVLTDEQHRFGVNQRKILTEKSEAVNVLVMSATPIPRTLAATVFGDMDFSVIKSKPSNRKEIITRYATEKSRERVYANVYNEVKNGNRAYIVAPSIEDSEDNNLISAEALYEELKKKFKGTKIGLIHGKLDKLEKERMMNEFAAGTIKVLVSTVVIEVGIDVPEATVIVIENAERFGLAQLHQLRGRVGRSDLQSYCYLICYSDAENAIERMNAMVTMSDGFEISEEDYRLRGAGDLMGTMQHGYSGNSFYDLFGYDKILKLATSDAEQILSKNQIELKGFVDLEQLQLRTNNIMVQDNSNII
ncbi:ATP-dependent DNA helicase RecG [Mogibacterium neglectum]|uniref:ATP-dependent DNA helicase RecG n=1 Tax=Mogibacterium neglectum TaxID=114528 RepID=UPI00272ACDCA|nr:ATP-dependent DNA helicase RecG [Mogibacterium neglectum]WLD77010.1 ATP-dependent DNA helicase RecG [Mogibacterium neglectum]